MGGWDDWIGFTVMVSCMNDVENPQRYMEI